jgi:hypothetical protein
MVVYRWVIPRMRNVQTKVAKKIKTHILCSGTFEKNRAVWDNRTGHRYQYNTAYMRIAFWVTKAVDTQSEYVILTACPGQQWSPERTLMWHSTYVDCQIYCKRQKMVNKQGVLQTVGAQTNAKFCILCVLLLVCSYFFRRNRHLQGAYTSAVKTLFLYVLTTLL